MRRRAFTLIELLVVIAVISLLLALLLPALHSARDRSRTVVCASNLRQVGTAIYNYWTEWNARVPWIFSPITNNYFGKSIAQMPDDQCDPFDRARWPYSIPNVLMPSYLGDETRVFVCPSAINGWPRAGDSPYRYTYRPAAANQPNGVITVKGTYIREFFGFLDGRYLERFQPDYGDDPLTNTIEYAKTRGTYMRDMIVRENEAVIGPHMQGVNLLNRDLQFEYREQPVITADLAPNYTATGAQF